MKKAISLILFVSILLSCFCAQADAISDLYLGLSAAMATFGGPEFKKDDIKVKSEAQRTYSVDAGEITMIFELSPLDSIRTGLVCAKDDSCAADFLCSSMAMICYLGDIDFTAFGQLLNKFGSKRHDNYTVSSSLGIDTFGISSTDEYQYVFCYMNNDLKTK